MSLDPSKYPTLVEIAKAVRQAPVALLQKPFFPVDPELYAKGTIEIVDWTKENGHDVLTRELMPMRSNFIWCGIAITGEQE